jgi:hypothetical protein
MHLLLNNYFKFNLQKFSGFFQKNRNYFIFSLIFINFERNREKKAWMIFI